MITPEPATRPVPAPPPPTYAVAAGGRRVGVHAPHAAGVLPRPERRGARGTDAALGEVKPDGGE